MAQIKTPNNQIEYVELEVNHYPPDKSVTVYQTVDIEPYVYISLLHGFYFRPRIFKPGTMKCLGVTNDGLAVVAKFIEEVLGRVVKDAKVVAEIRFTIFLKDDVYEQAKSKVKSAIEEIYRVKVCENDRRLRFATTVKNFEELKNLYETLSNIVSSSVPKPEDAKIVIRFVEPVTVHIPKDEIRKLYERLLETDALLNSGTARLLFGEEFAELVRKHNREARAKRCKKQRT